MNKTTLFLFLTIVPNLILGQYTDVINSNKPGESFSAFSVGTNVLQIETTTNFLMCNEIHRDELTTKTEPAGLHI